MKRAEDFESSARSQNPPVTFIVPPIDIPDAKILRDYIYKRFEDTWDSGGGPEVQSRTKPEWVTLTGLLDQGKPQPLALLFDTWNIFDNHQLVAYGYEGEPFSGPAFIHVYDNNNPNQEVRIAFDFTQSEMSGKLIDVAGNELTFVGDDKQVHTDYDPLKGFFCVTYTPETPPFSWGLSSGISVSPSTCQSAGAPMSFSATAANAFTFFHDSGQSTRITPVFSDPFLMQVVPANFKTDPGQDPVMTAPVPFAAAATFSQPGKFLETARLFVRVAVRRHHAIPGTPDAKFAVVNDMFGQPLTWFATLPALSSAATSPLPVTILERVKIQAVNRSASSCYYPFVEDAPVELFVANLPFSGPGITYLWEVSGAPTGPVQSPTLKILSLPSAGTVVKVAVTVTNPATGCIARGSLAIGTYTSETSERLTSYCQIAHQLVHLDIPGTIDPLGPDDPAFIRHVADNFGRIRSAAQNIVRLTDEVAKAAKD